MSQYDKVLIIVEVEKTDLDKDEIMEKIWKALKPLKPKTIINIVKVQYIEDYEE